MKTAKILSGFFRGKKGFVDFILIMVALFVMAIIIVVMYKAVKNVNTQIQTQQSIPQEIKDMSQTTKDRYVAVWDVLFLVFLILIFIVLLVSATLLDTHPGFFIFALIITIICAFIGMHLSNAYSDLESNPYLNEDATEFKIIPYIFRHFPTVIVIMGVVLSIVLYFKFRE